MDPNTTTTNRGGKISRGWEIAKSSWRVLTLDKELMALPVVSLLVNIAAIAVIAAVSLGSIAGVEAAKGDTVSFHSSAGWPFYLLLFILYIVLTVVSNFFGGAIIYGATERFRGGDPTLSSSIAGVERKFRPLLLFSLMMATIGLALQVLQDRLPFAGSIIAAIGGAAWNIANIFSVPIIVLSDKDVRPFEATKGSVGVIRKVWGEGVIAQFGIGIISALSFMIYFFGVGIIAIIGAALHLPVFLGIALLVLGIIGFLVLIVVFTTLSSIAKAALYYFATTGQAPEAFNHELLRSAMTPKKARKIFA
jgi:hypothetical protein